MAKSYIAKLNGKIVGKRTTKDRSYTHAIVIVPSRKYYEKRAYEYVATATDKSNYNYYLAIAEGRSPYPQSAEEQVRASGLVDGGYSAYIARVQEREIARFEERLAKGDFEPKVVSWAGRRDLAEKAARTYIAPWNDKVEIVLAEEVISKKAAKKAADALEDFNYVGSKHHY